MMGFIKRLTGAMLAVGVVFGAQPAMAETINMVCTYEPFQGYADIEVVWIDTTANKISSVFSLKDRPGMHGLNGGANADDALKNVKRRGWFNTWPATITATSVKWTARNDPTRLVEINRATGTLSWSTPDDPTPPTQGTAHCDKGTLPLPTPTTAPHPAPTAKSNVPR